MKDRAKDLKRRYKGLKLRIEDLKPSTISYQRPYHKPRTKPKPDLTYAFPIHRELINLPEVSSRDESARSFSLEVLGELRKQQVFSAPKSGLHDRTQTPEIDSMQDADWCCFPWAVVEFEKKTDGEAELCYCRAANSAAAALALQIQLLEKVVDESPPETSLIISFTTVGPVVKLWLTFQYVDNRGSREHVSFPNRQPETHADE